jgi:hypothetical protein
LLSHRSQIFFNHKEVILPDHLESSLTSSFQKNKWRTSNLNKGEPVEFEVGTYRNEVKMEDNEVAVQIRLLKHERAAPRAAPPAAAASGSSAGAAWAPASSTRPAPASPPSAPAPAPAPARAPAPAPAPPAAPPSFASDSVSDTDFDKMNLQNLGNDSYQPPGFGGGGGSNKPASSIYKGTGESPLMLGGGGGNVLDSLDGNFDLPELSLNTYGGGGSRSDLSMQLMLGQADEGYRNATKVRMRALRKSACCVCARFSPRLFFLSRVAAHLCHGLPRAQAL